ncbi:MarR family transcriptional regulator [Akkermansiaceae bacterium]|nr:MarR family transcriptional regulator [Akkermansiaceae bacterium]
MRPLDKEKTPATICPEQMFLPAFHDMLKPQWLATLTELKEAGGLAVSELSRRLGTSYMTVKQHCEDLTKLGYLKRSRVPRTEIGRPEIFYSLSEKADALFPAIPAEFTLGMLDQIQKMFGENSPDRLLFQYFQDQGEGWKARLAKGSTLLYRAQLFAKIRSQEGCFTRCLHDAEGGRIVLREFHNPLGSILAKYPRAVAMEQRAAEHALGGKLVREVSGEAGGIPAHVDFILAAPP